MTGNDMSGDEVPEKDVRYARRVLEDQVWRRRWVNVITGIAVTFVIVFFSALLYFIFSGSLRNASWIWSVADGPWFALADIPIIVALSTIPTLILMALLRHYHPGDESRKHAEEDAVSSSLALQVCREALKSLDQRP